MKLKPGVELHINKTKYVGEIPDSLVDEIKFEGDEKEAKKRKEAWIKKYKFVAEKQDSKSVKDVDTATSL